MQRGLLFVGILTATAWAHVAANHRIPDALSTPLGQIPRDIQGWHADRDNRLPDAVSDRLRPTSYLARRYRHKTDEVDLFISYYAQQRAGESMHSPKHCLPGSGWEIWNYGTTTVNVNGAPESINQYSISNMDERMVVFYWYQSRNRIIANEYAGKLLLIKDALFGGVTSGSLIRIMVPDTPEGVHNGLAFSSAVMSIMSRHLGTASHR